MDDKKLKALARRNAAKAAERAKPKPAYDATLDATRPAAVTPEEVAEAERLFKEMKKREF